MAVGRQIKRLREKAGVSAENLAKWIGVNADKLRKWEQRDSDRREVDKVKVEAYFNREINELDTLDTFAFYVPDPSLSPEAQLVDPEPTYIIYLAKKVKLTVFWKY
jgi:DNA-binding XRE family transcriptional regulator